jgi:hypothetical protein
MTYTSIALVFFGSFLVVWAAARFRGVLAEGLFEFRGGELVRIERAESPQVFWAQVAMMFVSVAAGLMMISQGSGIAHF